MTPTPPAVESRYLQGLFAPVLEELTAFDLPVRGRIPPGLDGRYLRNGPNPLRAGPGYHWFLGDGMVHGVRLRDGRAEWYRNRWVRSQAVAGSLHERWHEGPIHDSDFAANTHVIGHAGRTLATVEAGPLPYLLSDELDTLGPCDFGGTLRGGFAAHTKLDVRTGELHAIAYSYQQDHLQHVVVGADGRVSRTTGVPLPGKPMLHDFGLTERFVVLYDLPVTFSMAAARAGSHLPYAWNPEHAPRVGLLRRDGSGEVRWFAVDPCFVFHTLNAFEQGDRVIVDVCRYQGAYDLATLTSAQPAALDRWTIDPATGRVGLQRLSERSQEFPRIDDRRAGRPHRYGYTTVIDELERSSAGSPRSALLKHDLERGRVETHAFDPDLAGGEAIFVPSSPEAAEDDGYVLAFTHSRSGKASELLILAAQHFGAEPLARIRLPARVPLGLHGNWIPERGS
jgi:carotenoid cleavage dioxygenase-like enzyme